MEKWKQNGIDIYLREKIYLGSRYVVQLLLVKASALMSSRAEHFSWTRLAHPSLMVSAISEKNHTKILHTGDTPRALLYGFLLNICRFGCWAQPYGILTKFAQHSIIFAATFVEISYGCAQRLAWNLVLYVRQKTVKYGPQVDPRYEI